MLQEGQPIPAFSLPSDRAGQVSSEELLGSRYVVFVYPKDDTYGWTIEATEFRDRLVSFQALDVQVYGLSPDSIESHHAFAAKHELTFPLLSDEGSKWLESVGLWVERERDGKKFMGALRTTMLVGPDGKIERLWENVQFQDHAEAVLDAIRQNGS